jgi:hypothetical protein
MDYELIRDNNSDNFIINNSRIILLGLILLSFIIFSILFFDSNKKTVEGTYSDFIAQINKK